MISGHHDRQGECWKRHHHDASRCRQLPSAAPGRVARNRMRIAWMYYVEGLTQNEIADKLGIGRVTVVRNINEAIRQREVKIWIEGDVAECLELEGAIEGGLRLQGSGGGARSRPIPANHHQGHRRRGRHVYHRQSHRRHVDRRRLGCHAL